MESAKDTKARVRSRFGATAGRYVNSLHARGENLDALVRVAALSGLERVLDVGCGPGHTALALAPGSAQVSALDLVPEMLEAGRRLAAERGVSNLRFERGDVEELPYADTSFDLVASRFSAHHYPNPRRALAEIARVLRPGGRLLLLDSMSREDDEEDAFLDAIERLRDPSHVRDWRVSEWREMMTGCSFQVEERGHWLLSMDFADWVERMQTPPDSIRELRRRLQSASPPLRESFHIRENHDWQLPITLLEAQLPR